MPKKLELAGKIFGRLTVIEQHGRKDGKIAWFCECRCGGATIVAGSILNYGSTKSCGQCKAETTHPIEYQAWINMRKRCYDKNNASYMYYGAKGITVCSRWREEFYNFLDDIGKKPHHTMSLDRKDSAGNYEPDNCQWASASEQQYNRKPYTHKTPKEFR